MFDDAYFDEILFDYEAVAPPPVVSTPANAKAYNGYLCFMEQYIKNKVADTPPLKLPDGTLW